MTVNFRPCVFGFQKEVVVSPEEIDRELQKKIDIYSANGHQVDQSPTTLDQCRSLLANDNIQQNILRIFNNFEKLACYIPIFGLIVNISIVFVGGWEYQGAEKCQRIFRGVIESLGLGIIFLPFDLALMK